MTSSQADNQLRKNAAVAVFAISVLLNSLAAAFFSSHAIVALAAAAIALVLNALLLAALLRLFRLIEFNAEAPALVEQRCVLLAVMLAVAATLLALPAAWLGRDALYPALIQLAVLALAYVWLHRIARRR